MTFPPLADTQLGSYYELSTHLLALEMSRRGYEPNWLRRSMFVVKVDGSVLAFNLTRSNVTSSVGRELTRRKDYTRDLLADAGISVAAGGAYDPQQYRHALSKAEEVGWPVVVKPVAGRAGKGLSVGVRSAEDFRVAWESALALGPKVVVERQLDGREARFLTVGGRCVAVCERRAPSVAGDGQSTIAELVAAKQAARKMNPYLASKPLELTPARLAYLAAKGLSEDTVPADGSRVWLEDRGGLAGPPSIWGYGADTVDRTDYVHPTFLAVAAKVEKAFPSLGISGIDILARDFTRPATPDNYIVCEVNSRPELGPHHFPIEGTPRDVAKVIVDHCLRSRGVVSRAKAALRWPWRSWREGSPTVTP